MDAGREPVTMGEKHWTETCREELQKEGGVPTGCRRKLYAMAKNRQGWFSGAAQLTSRCCFVNGGAGQHRAPCRCHPKKAYTRRSTSRQSTNSADSAATYKQWMNAGRLNPLCWDNRQS